MCGTSVSWERIRVRRKGLLWLGIVAVTTIVALLTYKFLVAERASGIIYNGKTLEYWLSQTICTVVGTNGSSITRKSIHPHGQTQEAQLERIREVKLAYRAMGTNCLPFLVKKLQMHENGISLAIERLEDRFKIHRNPMDRDWQRGQAVTAFAYLDPPPEEIYEQIRALTKSGNPDVAASARFVLQTSHKLSDVLPTPK
jgi:hypothetical protein